MEKANVEKVIKEPKASELQVKGENISSEVNAEVDSEKSKDMRIILIFDSKGNYFCETIGSSNAAKITHGNPANIHRAASNGDLISTNGYYFVTKLQARGRTIQSIEKCLKVIIACNTTKGLSNRINSIYQFIK